MATKQELEEHVEYLENKLSQVRDMLDPDEEDDDDDEEEEEE